MHSMVYAPGRVPSHEDSPKSVSCPCAHSATKCSSCSASSERSSSAAPEKEGAEHGHEMAPIIGDVLRRGGEPLDSGVRSVMESRFGHNFGQVRVHADADAGRAADELHARAWTFGNHVVFGRGQYAPGEHRGNWVLAHELAHVVQQTGAPAAIARSSEAAVSGDDAFEREASIAADRVAAGAKASVAPARSSMSIRRIDTGKQKIATAPCGLTSEKFAEAVARHAAKHQINPILTTDKVSVSCRNSQPCDVVFSKLPVTVAVRWRMDVPWAVAGWDTKTGRKACRWIYHCDETGVVLKDTAEKCAEDNSVSPPAPGPGPSPGGPPAPPPTQGGDRIAAAMGGLLEGAGGDTA